MFLNIIPLTKLPISKPQIYTYSADGFENEVKIGQLIEAPLYYRNVSGIIQDIITQAPRDDIKYKQINSIVDPYPILNNKDIELAKFMGEYYFSSLGLILKQLAPDIPKRKTKKLLEALAKMNLSLINKRSSISQLSLDLITDALIKRRPHYLELIKKTLQEKKQILFLVPELMLLPQTKHWLNENFPNEDIVLLHSELSKTEQLISWRKGQTGASRIFLGTRRAIFTSFKNLGTIIIDEEQSLSYKQWDMNPHYDARTVAKKKAELYGCKLVFGTATPSVEAYFAYPPTSLITSPDQINNGGWQIINMRDELKKGNYSIFSEDLQAEIKQALLDNKQVILFVNRRGASTFVMCRDCGHVIRCPRCQIAMMEHTARTLSCNHCNFKTNSPLVCPKCKSNRIKGFGTGIEKVELELKKLFPDAKTLCVDSSNTSRLKTAKNKYKEFIDNKVNIIIGTQIALPLSSPNLKIIAAINIDSILNFPDWRTDEKSWQILNQLCRRDDVENCIIQTYNPENKLLQLLPKNGLEAFYPQELKNRELLKYPPYIKMMKLICKSDDYDFLLKESLKVANELKNIHNIQTIGPIKPINEKIRNFWLRHIIVKLPLNYHIDDLNKKLQELSSSWSIDVDPLT